MHNNYFFLRQLSLNLSEKLSGWIISECFSQNKDELILKMTGKHEQLFLKADLKEQFSCLSFSDDYSRAKKNSIDLFPEIIDRKIGMVYQFPFERAFSLELDNEVQVIFKLFGNFSNIIILEGGNCTHIFKSKLKDDIHFKPGLLEVKSPPTKELFLSREDIPWENYPYLDRHIKRHLDKMGVNVASKEGKWDIMQSLLQYLENPRYYIYESDGQIKLSLFEENKIIHQLNDPVSAINTFYQIRQKKQGLLQESHRYSSEIREQLRRTENYIRKTEEKLKEIKDSSHLRTIGDLLMANLHRITPGESQVELMDFYHEQPVTIKLNPSLSPQKNAENYYRKSKNRQREIDTLQKNLEEKKVNQKKLQQHLEKIAIQDDTRSLRKYLEENKLVKKKHASPQAVPEFKEYHYQSFKILVGRNAKNNDYLTFREGYKEDLWLHARDVTGSHVLVKYQAGKSFPKPVIEKAAALAAYFSKNRNNSLVPVIYTPRKYVRKSKGLPAGAVFVDREEVILVRPEEQI